MQFGSTLDTIIAVVVILLVLSLIVQSIQTAFKKLIKIKSRQIEDSLLDLFQTVLNQPPGAVTGWFSRLRNSSPVFGAIFSKPKADASPVNPAADAKTDAGDGTASQPSAASVTSEVIGRFKEIGRFAASGKPMLDSLSRDDLLKVLEKIAPDQLVGDLSNRVKDVIEKYDSLCAAIGEIKSLEGSLSGDSSATLARMQQALAPLLNDLASLKNKGLSVVIGDLLRLREVKLDDVLKLLGDLQSRVEADQKTAPEESKQALASLAEALKTVAARLTSLREDLDKAVAPIKGKVEQVGAWYDAVMQSFEERYNRGMKTAAIVIGFVVVILLNANFFQICQTLSTNPFARNKIVSYGEEIQRKKNEKRVTEAANDSAGAAKIDAVIKDLQHQYDAETAAYTSLGFDRLHLSDVSQWWRGWSTDDTLDKIKRDIIGLIGWIITALLLSVGAPFWQDTLESLFGVKNLLRKKGGQDGSNDKMLSANAKGDGDDK